VLHECAAEDGVLLGSGRLAKRLALLRRERSNEDETDDVFGLRRRIRDHRAAVGVTDRDHRALDLLKDLREAESLATPRSGIAGAVTGTPLACTRSITPFQLEPSANAPCTNTTVGVFVWDAAAITRRG
jgi:hypothetical protein